MKKNIVLITAFILAATLIFAWSDQPTITKTHVMTDISVDQQVIKEVTPNVNSYSRELGSNEVPFMVDRKDSKKEVAEEVEISQEMSRLEVHQANLIALKAAGEPIPIVVMEDTCSGDSIQIEILTDSYYSETTWELYDQIGPTLIASGAPTAASTVHNWQVCVEVDQCYDFYVYDSYGDGIYAPGYCDVSLNGALIWHFAQEWTTVATGELGGGCAAPEGACCVAEVCVATNTEAECDGLGGSWHIGETCPEYWCEDDWNCTDNPPTDKDPGGDIDTPSEPLNDSLSGAAPAFVEHAYCGTLAPPVDPDDYYVVTLPAGPDPFYCLHVRVFADDTPHQYAYGLGLDTKLYIYDDDSLNTQLYYQDDNNGTFPDAEHYDSQYDCTNPDNCYPAGKTLYIRVSGFSSVDPVPYLLIINAIPCEGDPLGRCCYGDPYAPTCTDETEGDCDALTGTWDFGLNCVDDPCVALPANDECADAQVITEVTDYTFTTVGATTDGINNYANQNVWFCYTP
ncbi:MAG: hypothetical protein GY839_19010, partial [candidate division Zixibacteria bacterium]|nr:hypothetical protein [candidate division Zixibacteria bacterium]